MHAEKLPLTVAPSGPGVVLPIAPPFKTVIDVEARLVEVSRLSPEDAFKAHGEAGGIVQFCRDSKAPDEVLRDWIRQELVIKRQIALLVTAEKTIGRPTKDAGLKNSRLSWRFSRGERDVFYAIAKVPDDVFKVFLQFEPRPSVKALIDLGKRLIKIEPEEQAREEERKRREEERERIRAEQEAAEKQAEQERLMKALNDPSAPTIDRVKAFLAITPEGPLRDASTKILDLVFETYAEAVTYKKKDPAIYRQLYGAVERIAEACEILTRVPPHMKTKGFAFKTGMVERIALLFEEGA
jgi:hypothetical protein